MSDGDGLAAMGAQGEPHAASTAHADWLLTFGIWAVDHLEELGILIDGDMSTLDQVSK
jgi:hypothetical protein